MTQLRLHFTGNALFEIGARSIPSILRLLESDREPLRIQAFHTLGWLEVEEEPARRAFLGGLTDASEVVRRIARNFCNRRHLKGELAIPILAAGLQKTPDIYKDCAHLLINLMEENPRAGSALGAAMSDPGNPARSYILKYMGQHGEPSISTPTLAPAVVPLLDDADPVVRRNAAAILRNTRADSPEVINNLARVLGNDPDRVVRHAAVLALRDLAPASRPALPAIRKALDDPYELVRRFARYALDKLEKPEESPQAIVK